MSSCDASALAAQQGSGSCPMGYNLLRNEKNRWGWEWFVSSFSIDPHIPHPGLSILGSPLSSGVKVL